MKYLYGNAVVGQSGGPTTAINATLAGVILGAKEACRRGVIPHLYGMRNGVEGLLREDLVDLFSAVPDQKMIELLKSTPAAALGSCRKKLPSLEEADDSVYRQLLAVFQKNNIRYFFYIGGNDSMDTVAKLSGFMEKSGYEMRIMGVPKTIDNDLYGTDHTPGFGSAAKYIATTVSEILRDCAVYTLPAVTIVEIMGRDAGWLTTAAALAGSATGERPDLIYLPERTFDLEAFLTAVREALTVHPNVVVAVSEGLRFADGRYVGEGAQSGALDVFGHRYLAGTGKVLESAVKSRIGCKARSVELNISQRCAAHMASLTDIRESVAVGRQAVRGAVRGESGKMMCILREPSPQYCVRYQGKRIEEIANRVRQVPDAYINAKGNGVTEECLSYLRPLILGETHPFYQNGLPLHLVLK